MSFNQYTSCISSIYYDKTNQYVQATIVATGVCAPLAVLPALVSPWCLFFLIPVFAAAWLLGYCQWFLHGRLICLPSPSDPKGSSGSDQMAIGMVVDLLPPNLNTFPTSVDTDYSFGLLVAGSTAGDQNRQDAENSTPYGFLLKEQQVIIDLGIPFTGNQGTDKQTKITSWILHCEFEGAGVRDLMLAAAIALPLAIASLFVCMLVPGWVGLLIALLLAILSLLTDGAGAVIGINDEASPADENPALGAELHSGDVLVVSGAWVYDSGHSHDSPPRGYNEIHPVKFCSPLGNFGGDWPPNLNELEAEWGTAIGQATSPVTLENQKQPQNQWEVHPLLDGCEPAVIV
jgi:hypothetical protein